MLSESALDRLAAEHAAEKRPFSAYAPMAEFNMDSAILYAEMFNMTPALIASARDLLDLRAKLKGLAEEWEANAADFENSKNDQWKNRLSRARLAKNAAARIRKLLEECQ
jgi:hypothetical protein